MQRNEVEAIARLARVALTREEQERYGAQLTDILSYFEKLQELSTPTGSAAGDPPPARTRADTPVTWPERERLLDQCPQVEDGCMIVPRILE